MGEENKALRLLGPGATPKGRDLRLRDGDVLVAVNGQAFSGSEKDLSALFIEANGHALVLSFHRGSTLFNVLSTSSRLGAWEPIDWSPDLSPSKLNPDVMTNREFFRGANGLYDVQPLAPGMLALIAPPVWLLQMRLWVPSAALIAAMMVAFAVSPLMAIAAYLAAGMHIWHSGPKYFRNDREARGFLAEIVIAAPSEKAAHAAYTRLNPDTRFVFSPEPQPSTEQDA